MDWDRIEGNWKTFKGQAKEHRGRLQRQYGFSKDRIRTDVDPWLDSI